MTTLHMEVETARGAQSNMTNTYQQLTSLIQSMTSTVNGLQSAWMGNSATEFLGAYDQWRSSMNTALENLNTWPPACRTRSTNGSRWPASWHSLFLFLFLFPTSCPRMTRPGRPPAGMGPPGILIYGR